MGEARARQVIRDREHRRQERFKERTVELPLGRVDITMETVPARENMRTAWAVRESQRSRRRCGLKTATLDRCGLTRPWTLAG